MIYFYLFIGAFASYLIGRLHEMRHQDKIEEKLRDNLIHALQELKKSRGIQ